VDDVARALVHCAADDRLVGPVNLTAPTPVTNRELSRALADALHRPAVVPVPAFALRLLYGEMASIIVTGQRVVPTRLLAADFEFSQTELEPALRDILSTG
jgi:NAD dependent epimerase/dehydratase family enzyme